MKKKVKNVETKTEKDKKNPRIILEATEIFI